MDSDGGVKIATRGVKVVMRGVEVATRGVKIAMRGKMRELYCTTETRLELDRDHTLC